MITKLVDALHRRWGTPSLTSSTDKDALECAEAMLDELNASFGEVCAERDAMSRDLLTLTTSIETFRADPHRRNMAALFASVDGIGAGDD